MKGLLKGLLIVNHYLNTNKFTTLHKFILDSAKRYNITLSIMTNRECMIDISSKPEYIKDIDFVLFWDKDCVLARYLENMGCRLFNRREAIEVCDDKALTHIELIKTGLLMPKTIIAPMTYENIGYGDGEVEFLQEVSDSIGFPMVVKERFSSFGMQVYKVNSYNELTNLFNTLQSTKLIFQENIASSYGRDIRLEVVGDNVVASMYRHSTDDFRANVTNGAKATNYSPNKEQIEVAVKAAKALNLDFAGVDILFGKNDEPVVCEVNSNAHFVNIYKCTGINAADNIFEHIINELSIKK